MNLRGKRAAAYSARYKAHRNYSTRQLRQVLVDDACGRVCTPLQWMLTAVSMIAMAEHTTDEVVFASIRSECVSRTGMELPTAGVI